MKNLMAIAAIFGTICFQSCGSQKETENAPEAVLKAFNDKFKGVEKLEWEKENETEWEAEFEINGKEYSANFDLEGNWKETEFEIENSGLPAAVKQTLDVQFAEYTIEEAEIAETPDGRFYEIEIKNGDKEYELKIDEEGNLIDQEEAEDEE